MSSPFRLTTTGALNNYLPQLVSQIPGIKMTLKRTIVKTIKQTEKTCQMSNQTKVKLQAHSTARVKLSKMQTREKKSPPFAVAVEYELRMRRF